MSYIEIEKSVKKNEWFMHDLHSHTHYEMYFLLEGTRSFFLSNEFYTIKAPSLIIIPPHILHKTEGGPFTRININVFPDYLDDFQQNELNKNALHIISPNSNDTKSFVSVLKEMLSLDKLAPFYDCKIKTLFSFIIYEISKLSYGELAPRSATKNDTPPVILKIIDYLQNNYMYRITLDNIKDKFFMSKGSLIYNFKKYTGFSLIDFLLNIRLTKSKELLTNTKKSVSEISEVCGFSSANYYALIFKQKEGLSPQNYRKVQQNKN